MWNKRMSNNHEEKSIQDKSSLHGIIAFSGRKFVIYIWYDLHDANSCIAD